MTDKHYFLHRVSHEGNVSYSLLEKGYLTLGWSELSLSGLLEAAREPGYPKFDLICKNYDFSGFRSRWWVWYIAQMKKGDIVVVPLPYGEFSVYEVIEEAHPITELEKEEKEIVPKWNNNKILWEEDTDKKGEKGKFLKDQEENRWIDLGFYVKVKEIVKNVRRCYVSGKLISRMHYRGTCARIDDLKEEVNEAIDCGKNNAPISIHEKLVSKSVKSLLEELEANVDDIKLEKLIKWYFFKCGANNVDIPSKNEAGKENGADADVIAVFDNLKHVVYVQAKHHQGSTPEWCVQQITEYQKQKNSYAPDYSYSQWVITTAVNFTDNAKNLAIENNVRLINGSEFIEMLLDKGLENIDDAF